MMVTTTTGYIIECFGPYLANGANNDAKITEQILRDHQSVASFFKENDCFIVDRGFRDCVEFWNQIGINVEMPAFLLNAKQHSVEEANESRLVTKVR